MKYRCVDCSYTAKSQFPAGKCPACGSFDIKNQSSEGKRDGVDKIQQPMRLYLLIALWAVLIGIIIYKLSAD